MNNPVKGALISKSLWITHLPKSSHLGQFITEALVHSVPLTQLERTWKLADYKYDLGQGTI